MCRPFQSVIILVINKSDSCCAIVRFCYHSYDYRMNWTPLSPIHITYDDDDDVELIKLRGFPWGKICSQVFIPRLQTSGTFLRICADPRSADFCIVLVRSLIPNCSKWPASFFDTEPNAPTSTGTTFVLDLQILLISLARSSYFSYFSVSFCSTLLSPEQLCPQ